MRMLWLVLALVVTLYITLLPEQSLLTRIWQLSNNMWHTAELAVAKHAEFIHLLQATKLVLY